MVEYKKEDVWYVDINDLVRRHKGIKTLRYKDLEITVFEMDKIKYFGYQNFLFKDSGGVYWDLEIEQVKFNWFEQVVYNDGSEMQKEYCEKIYSGLKDLDLKKLFEAKILDQKHFGKCQMKYIEVHYPELYNDALKSRDVFILDKKSKYEKEEERRKEEVEKKKERLEKDLKWLKQKILNRESLIQNRDFLFYKDDNYENGVTKQKGILYLAEQYGIETPGKIKDSINNDIVEFNFADGDYCVDFNSYAESGNEIKEYLSQLYEKVLEEHKQSKVVDFLGKWYGKTIEDWGATTSPEYKQFEREYKTLLKKIGNDIDMTLHSFNGNHYDFSAVMKHNDTNKFYYISISNVRYFKDEWADNILYRTMEHDKDWRGGSNNSSTLADLGKNLDEIHKRYNPSQKIEANYEYEIVV